MGTVIEHVEGWHFDVVIHFNSEPGPGKELNLTPGDREKARPEKWAELQKEAKEWLAELLSEPCEIESLRVHRVGNHFKVKGGP